MNSSDTPPHPEDAIRDVKIQPGHTVLLKLPSGDMKAVKVDKDSYVPLQFACGLAHLSSV